MKHLSTGCMWKVRLEYTDSAKETKDAELFIMNKSDKLDDNLGEAVKLTCEHLYNTTDYKVKSLEYVGTVSGDVKSNPTKQRKKEAVCELDESGELVVNDPEKLAQLAGIGEPLRKSA